MLAPAQPRALNSPSSIAFLVPPAHVWSGDPFGDDPIARPSSEIALARDERNVAKALVPVSEAWRTIAIVRVGFDAVGV